MSKRAREQESKRAREQESKRDSVESGSVAHKNHFCCNATDLQLISNSKKWPCILPRGVNASGVFSKDKKRASWVKTRRSLKKLMAKA